MITYIHQMYEFPRSSLGTLTKSEGLLYPSARSTVHRVLGKYLAF
jgi:hypothetical protein